MEDDHILSVVGEVLHSLVDRIEALEARVYRKRTPRHEPKRATTVELPGRFPWPTKHPDRPGVRLTQPLVTKQ